MPDSPEIRISDADRQVMINRLSTAYAEGRLTESELEERIAVAGRARTASELAALASDLPGTNQAPQATLTTMERLRARLAGNQIFFAPPIISTVIWLITSPGGNFWPIWVWFGSFVPVLFALLGGDDDETPDDGAGTNNR